MAEQEIQGKQEENADQETQPAPAMPMNPTPAVQQMTAGLDDVLDDIESVLEENAHDYVSHFVQKGGQ